MEESFVEAILFSDSVHPAISQVCAYLVKPFKSRTPFLLMVNHSESFSLAIEDIWALFEARMSKIYVSDIKKARYHLPIDKPLICLKTLKWLESGEVLDDSKYNTPAHNFLYSKYPDKADINRIIPLVKIQEKWNNYIQDNKKLLHSPIQNKKYFKFYNTLVNDALLWTEYEGLSVNLEALSKSYSDVATHNLHLDGKVYTHYNINTATGRPSNSFGGINFSAMNKGDNSRGFIIAGNDILVEFDYHSYHPKMLCELIGYEFEGGDIHSHLGRLYFDEEILTDEQYIDAKNLTFKLLYTNADDYMHIPFFRKVRDYKEKMWKAYREKGYLEAIVSKRPITGIESKTQILPYLLQSYETERNALIMHDMQAYLADKKTKLVLYCYDSFLFDVSLSDGPEVLETLQGMLEVDGYTTSVKAGKDYAHLTHLES